MADQGTKLLVNNLPSELNEDDKKDILRLFGATEVICFEKKGRLRNSAFASFLDCAASTLALKRLHQIEILGCKLKVEYASSAFEELANTHESRKVLNKTSNIGATTKLKNDGLRETSKEEDKEDLSDAMAPKLGVHRTFPKNLSYLYPAPTVNTLTNIANALATVPRFYTQVLHLMNKMNLPPPFTGPTITPPLPDDTITLADVCLDTSDLQNYASSEESEFESDHENSHERKRIGDGITGLQEPARKRIRLKPAAMNVANRNKTNKPQQQQIVEEAFEQSQQVTLKRIEFKLAKTIASSLNSLSNSRNSPTQQTTISENVPDQNSNEIMTSSQGFGVFEPTNDENEVASEEDESRFISSKNIELNRMSANDLNSLTLMKKYDKGSPSNRLYIKNLAKQTSKEDLEFIFRRFIDKCDETQKEKFDIRLMKEGRMKGQAFVTFPSLVQAENALEMLHGFVLHEKPIIIQYGRMAE